MRSKLLLLLCLLVSSLPAQAKVRFNIEGISGALKKNVEIYLSALDTRGIEDTARFRDQFRSDIDNAMKALGYYSPTYEFSWNEDDDNPVVTIDIDKGPATRIKAADIQLIGAGNSDETLRELLANSDVRVGKVLNHGEYDALKSALQNTALRLGYFDAKFETSQMQVAPSRHEAFITLHFSTGERYRFGDTSIDGSQIKDERVRSMIPWKAGDYYDALLLGEFNQNLSSSQWFASIFVEPLIEQASDYEIPVHVTVTPQAKNQVEVGLGYSTDVGARMRLNWRKPWVHSRGHSWNTQMEISAVQPKVETVYRIPLDDVLKNYYQIVGGLRYVDSHDTVSTEFSAGFERHWVLDSGWQRTASIRYLFEDYKQGADEAGIMQLIVPGITYSRTRSRGGAMPTWADKQTISIEATHPSLGSDTEILRLRARSGWIRSLTENQRVLFKVDSGAVFADGITKVPPSMRFFAGGDNSIRGYGYESIAPRDSQGQLRGGRYLVAATAEYQYRVYGNWWLAAFYDYGDAWNEAPDWNRATGLGVRWSSPVGPIRLDVASGLDNPTDDYRIHFTLGPEF
uniref:autotransporter assembly complex protein TamA n=1 Tax=Thaumasiovibrio occultus TaxID=1891184 RepID=UPI000B36207E|nr:autotransporter assembly complex family protein [Thaumasiovibrio occultus]